MQSLFEYDEYSDFLRDWIKCQPKNGRGVLKGWAERLRVDASVISQVMNRRKVLNLDQAFNLCEIMEFNEMESEYFLTLVEVKIAGTFKLKNYLLNKARKLKTESLNLANRVKHNKVLSSEEQAQFYSSWIYAAVKLATSLNGKQTAESIASLLGLTLEKTIEILKFLVECNLVSKSYPFYSMNPEQTYLERTSPFLPKHHANWRIQAIQRSEALSEEELMFTAPISISKKDFGILRERIAKLISEASELVGNSEAEKLAVFQVDLFWMKP